MSALSTMRPEISLQFARNEKENKSGLKDERSAKKIRESHKNVREYIKQFKDIHTKKSEIAEKKRLGSVLKEPDYVLWRLKNYLSQQSIIEEKFNQYKKGVGNKNEWKNSKLNSEYQFHINEITKELLEISESGELNPAGKFTDSEYRIAIAIREFGLGSLSKKKSR